MADLTTGILQVMQNYSLCSGFNNRENMKDNLVWVAGCIITRLMITFLIFNTAIFWHYIGQSGIFFRSKKRTSVNFDLDLLTANGGVTELEYYEVNGLKNRQSLSKL